MRKMPLLNRVFPYPDETLASWSWRLAKRNHIQSPKALLNHLQQTLPDFPLVGLHALNHVQDETVLQGLADLSGISLDEVYHLTYHRFASRLIRPERQNELSAGISDSSLVFGPRRKSFDIYTPKLNWCPHCLSEKQYVRWHWQIPLVVSCDVHDCWLVEQCPECNTRMREADIIHGQCSSCGFLLTAIIPPTIPKQDLLLQQQSVLMNWLYGTTVPSYLGLPDSPARPLLYVLLGLRYAAQRAGNGWFFHHIPPGIPVPDLDIVKRQYLTLFERGCLYTTAFQGLLDWPHGFFDYLDAYRQRPVFDAKETGLRREFGVLYMSWFEEYWKHPGFEFVQTAFNDYLVERLPAYMVAFSKRAYDPDLLYRLDYLTIEQAARYVECPARAVRRLVAEGHLTAHHFDYFEQEDRLWVSRHELDQLLQQWEGHLTAPEVAQMLGITLEIARELIATPLLEVVPDDAGKQWMLIYVYRHSVLQFIQRLKKHTTILANPQLHGVSIAEVSIHNGSIGLGFPEIWQRICDGKLTACHPHESLFPLTDLWFWPETVANISQTVKDEHDWITLMETLDCLGVKRPVLDHFLEAGLFQPVKAFGQKQFFRRSDVEALRDCAVSSRQAAELLNTSLSRFLELNRQGYFSPLSGPGINRHTHYIFDRHELLAWHKEYLVMSELKQLVGVDPYVFLREHRILPVFRKPSVYLRREVMAVISAEMS